MADNLEFAVVDTETSGLSPERGDRIIEIALIRIDQSGRRLYEFESLINPSRDVGPTKLHGITAEQIKHAPAFREVAGDLLVGLKSAVFVGHNAAFDYRFVSFEFRRLGLAFGNMPLMCTMQLAHMTWGGSKRRSLKRCCVRCGLTLSKAHCAYDDAVATANLLCWFLDEQARAGKKIHVKFNPVVFDSWPDIRLSGKIYSRRQSSATGEIHSPVKKRE